MLDAWKRHGLWQQYGEKQTVPFRQTVEEHIASFHGRSSLSRQRMSQEQAAAFDAELRTLRARRLSIVVRRRLGGMGKAHGVIRAATRAGRTARFLLA
jgi:hypothetical protein